MRSNLPLASFLAILAPTLLGNGDGDPGVLIDVDLTRFELRVLDLDDAATGPALRVSVGSPSHPTPVGEFRPVRIVRNPSWRPGPVARSLGARFHPPSNDGPLGAGKLPLEHGAIQIHAGADPLELGKPNSLGCVRIDDEGWTVLLDWLEERDTLRPWRDGADGEVETGFRRPVRVVVR